MQKKKNLVTVTIEVNFTKRSKPKYKQNANKRWGKGKTLVYLRIEC